MLQSITRLNFDDLIYVKPAFLTYTLIRFTSNIGLGMKAGSVTLPFVKILTGITKKLIITLIDGRTVSVIASALRDSSGYVVGAITSIRDITERQRMMEENVAMRERLAATLEKIDHGVMLYDENRKIIFYNKKFMELTGSTASVLDSTDSLAGHTRRRGIVSNMDEIQEKMKGAYVSKKKTSVECLHNDGTPSMIYTVEPISTPAGRFLGFMATITEK